VDTIKAVDNLSLNQGYYAFKINQGHGGQYCPLLPQAMSIKNKGVLRLGVTTMQLEDIQKWVEHSQCCEDHKQLSPETLEATPQWLAEVK